MRRPTLGGSNCRTLPCDDSRRVDLRVQESQVDPGRLLRPGFSLYSRSFWSIHPGSTISRPRTPLASGVQDAIGDADSSRAGSATLSRGLTVLSGEPDSLNAQYRTLCAEVAFGRSLILQNRHHPGPAALDRPAGGLKRPQESAGTPSQLLVNWPKLQPCLSETDVSKTAALTA